MSPTKAIIPVAGYGTRRLPITKVIEKSMMPLLNRPVVDYIVQDCIRVGIKDIYFVTGKDAVQLRAYYSGHTALEDYLKAKNEIAKLASIQPPGGVSFHFIEQDQTDGIYGTSVPVWLCKDEIEQDESVLIIMGDQYLYREDGGSDFVDLVKAVETQQTDAGMVAVLVPAEQVSNYGIIALTEDKLFSHIAENPSPEEAPSNLNNASIYLVPSKFWEYVKHDINRTRDGEYKITDVLNDFVNNKNTITVSQAKGKYLDCGTLQGWVEANNYLLGQIQQ